MSPVQILAKRSSFSWLKSRFGINAAFKVLLTQDSSVCVTRVEQTLVGIDSDTTNNGDDESRDLGGRHRCLCFAVGESAQNGD